MHWLYPQNIIQLHSFLNVESGKNWNHDYNHVLQFQRAPEDSKPLLETLTSNSKRENSAKLIFKRIKCYYCVAFDVKQRNKVDENAINALNYKLKLFWAWD